jgi:hypothetical protein
MTRKAGKKREVLKGRWLRLWKGHMREMGGLCLCGLHHDLWMRQINESRIERVG